MSEKVFYGLMALLLAIGVLTAPFAYARSMRFLNHRSKKDEKEENRQPENNKQPENNRMNP